LQPLFSQFLFIETDVKLFFVGVIVVYLFRIAKFLIIGIRYYPILALFCATFYVWLVFVISIISSSLCSSDFYPSKANFDDTNGSDIAEYFLFYGTGSNLIVIQLFTALPRYQSAAFLYSSLYRAEF